jgi:tight adherence protein C
MLIIFAIGACTFVAVTVAALQLLSPRESVVRRRIGTGAQEVAVPDRRLRGSVVSRLLGPGARRGGRTLSRLLPQNMVRRVDHMLVMANEPWTLSGFLLVWAISIAGGVAMFAYLALTSSLSPFQLFSIGVLIIPFGILVPYAVLRRRVKNRQKRIIRALPDALDLLVTSVEAGLGVDAAFAMVAEKTEGPLSETFSLYLRQVGLGRSRHEALEFAAHRTGVPDLIQLAASVSQGEALGTTVGDVLRAQAKDLRIARRQRAEAAAQRAPVLMTIPLALCFLPAMGAVIVVPSVLNLINFVQDLGQNG